jgi:hypothetical protein
MPFFSIADGLLEDKQILTLTLMENHIQMAVFEAAKDIPIKLYFGLDACGDEKPGRQFTHFYSWINLDDEFKTYKVIQIEYWDILGNIYTQTVQLQGKQFTITPPQVNYRYELEYFKRKKLINRIKSIFKKKKPVTSIFLEYEKP